MDVLTAIPDQVALMRGLLADAVRPEGAASDGHPVGMPDSLPAGAPSLSVAIGRLDDAAVVELLEAVSVLGKMVDQVRAAVAGVAARRSVRSRGHTGLAQSRGLRSGVALVQQVGGLTRAEAARQVRVGEALLEVPEGGRCDVEEGDSAVQAGGAGRSGVPANGPLVWHEPLHRGLCEGTLTLAQHDAIRRGLGEPPERVDTSAGLVRVGDGPYPGPADATVAAWSRAAARLATEAAFVSVEELAKTARSVRDRLDPSGAEERYRARYEARSFRMWIDGEGVSHGRFVFDDESAAWVRAITDAGLRPRRGGPRFVDPEERRRATALAEDPRSNEQLAFDLMLDVMKAGAVADSEQVFGKRQPGVRYVQVVGPDGVAVGAAHGEEEGVPVPGWVAEQRVCSTGVLTARIDPAGNVLDLGREQRLYTSRQRIALALRDGGCRWPGCDRPASYCEAHHIDEWKADGGRTDIDRGILLCAFHHMELHANRWRITREDTGDFLLRHRSGETAVMRPSLRLAYAWAGLDPPPRRFCSAA